MSRLRTTTISLVALLVAAVFGSGCASSSSQQREESAQSERGERSRDDRSSGSEELREKMKVKRRVHFEEILGTELGDKRPPGCSGTWDRLKNSAYKGVSYFCSEFNGPDKWGDVPVTMAVKGGRLSVVKVQLFFDDTSGAKDEFQDLTGELIGRCDQLTGFDRNAIFDCGDYVADVEWFPGHDSAQLQVVYARSMESLDKDIEPED